ncbi:MAG: universal stress protein [Anaerolineales bacterium]|nr:universal stress protein [Anaerolineales bacterium]MCS7248499.1 universal stress protein [Anaerolineales bacterium]MDW8162312.1 universal stress protein [Anaerolineales bacterium]MDW8447962.1 universal stress protein [Anaerolineales bacterium]
MDAPIESYIEALNEFQRARNQAQLRVLLARLRGESNELLDFEEVRKRLKAQGMIERGLRQIPLDAIVGSLGRYHDFTRDFLPKRDHIKDRWARVRVAFTGLTGIPPIEVYQIGEAYFVKDGNHRVSVARQLGATHIQAYVTEVRTRVPLTPDVNPENFIIKEEYLEFLEKTQLDRHYPEIDLSVSIAGQYRTLMEHIEVHRYFMGIEQRREVSFEEAAVHWYENYYLPVTKQIIELGILRSYPDRTPTDLYLFMAEHRAEIEKHLGWEIRTEKAILAFMDRAKKNLKERLRSLLEEIAIRFLGGKFSAGPPVGEWRQRTIVVGSSSALIQDILVPIDGREGGWTATQQAIKVAERENAYLRAIHIEENNLRAEDHARLSQTFENLFKDLPIRHDLVIVRGNIADTICERSRYIDLVVINVQYPPGPLPLDRLASGFRELVQRCPRPILATPRVVSPLTHGLLAFNGSPKAQEALHLAVYLAKKWSISLTVLSVEEKASQAEKYLNIARKHLTYRKVKAEYVQSKAPVAQAILSTAAHYGCDFIIVGGYGYAPLMQVLLGSVVDELLRLSPIPLLICR